MGKSRRRASTGWGSMESSSGSKPYTSFISQAAGTPIFRRNEFITGGKKLFGLLSFRLFTSYSMIVRTPQLTANGGLLKDNPSYF